MMAQHGNDEELSVIVTGGASGINRYMAQVFRAACRAD